MLCRTCRFALVSSGITTPSGVIAAVPFRGRARDVVLGLKYGNRRAVSRHLAGLLVNRLIEAGAHRDVDVVTWAPTSTARRRRRGFDQAELVATTVARQLGLPVRELLRRTDETHQTGVGRAERQQQATFVAHPRTDGRRVLIVDDVVTTGATISACASVLREAGARRVRALTFACAEASGLGDSGLAA